MRKPTFTKDEKQVEELLDKVKELLSNTQYDIEIYITFMDNVPEAKQLLHSLHNNVVDMELSEDGEDVYAVELAASQSDDTWNADADGCIYLPNERRY